MIRGQHDVLEPLRRSEGGVPVAAKGLHLHETHGDRAERDEEHEQGTDEAMMGPGHPTASHHHPRVTARLPGRQGPAGRTVGTRSHRTVAA